MVFDARDKAFFFGGAFARSIFDSILFLHRFETMDAKTAADTIFVGRDRA